MDLVTLVPNLQLDIFVIFSNSNNEHGIKWRLLEI
jgi:hypothetical protein